MEVTVLGCCGSYPGPGGACSGYLVRSGSVSVALDLGTGTLANLQRHLNVRDLTAVVLSHEHPDHWVDLTGLRVLLRYGLERSGVRVYGTPGTRAMAERVCGHLTPTFDWVDIIDGDRFEIEHLSFRVAATEHYVPTLAVRIDGPEGRSLAYSADTGPGWSFTSLGEGIDVALCEATTLADGEGDGVLHLSARQAGLAAHEAGIDRLIITHLQPGVEREASQVEAESSFGAPVEVATEDRTFVL